MLCYDWSFLNHRLYLLVIFDFKHWNSISDARRYTHSCCRGGTQEVPGLVESGVFFLCLFFRGSVKVTEVEEDLSDAPVLMSSLAALPGDFSSLCLS